jgi:branched-chain amino acid transport system permease protein
MELDEHSGAVVVDNADRLALKEASGIAARAGFGAGDALRSAAMIAVVAGLPLVMPINIATEVVIFGIFAMATNLLIGTAGLYSFGQAAFFGTVTLQDTSRRVAGSRCRLLCCWLRRPVHCSRP